MSVRKIQNDLDSTRSKFADKASLTPKISSDQILVDGLFGQVLTESFFTIFRHNFFCDSLRS
jgi:hypothetical protein